MYSNLTVQKSAQKHRFLHTSFIKPTSKVRKLQAKKQEKHTQMRLCFQFPLTPFIFLTQIYTHTHTHTPSHMHVRAKITCELPC